MIGTINPKELKDMLAQKAKGQNDFILIDCRELAEWNSGHIPGAQFFPLSNAQHEITKLSDFKNKTIVVGCRSGKRSFDFCMMLMSHGFDNIMNLEGGILAWSEAGYSTEI